MAKSLDAFRTISEVSEWLDTPAHVLRFWESKFSQIKPVKRAGGRRYYRPDDMALLAGIKTLLHDQGLTIKGAQKLLREKGVKYVAALGADPRETPESALGNVIDAEARDIAPEAETTTEPAPIQRVDPVEWDPDDPWPADPVPADESIAPEPAEALQPDAPEPEVAATQAEPEEVALPFVRARSQAPATEPESPARLAFPAPPPMPDEAAIEGGPGLLSHLLAADRSRLLRRSAEITPLASRLREIVQRMDAGGV